MKKVIAACIDRILEFGNQQEALEYLNQLSSKTKFRIVDCKNFKDRYTIRIQHQYNKNKMIED